MVLLDHAGNRRRKFVLLSQLHPVFHMRCYDKRGEGRTDLVVRVSLRKLVLGKEIRALKLAAVVVKRTHTHEQRVRSYGLGRRFTQVPYKNRMMVSARRLQQKPPEKRMAGIR